MGKEAKAQHRCLVVYLKFLSFGFKQGKRLLPLFAALHLAEEITAQLSALKIYALTLGDEYLELHNFDAVQPARAA